MTLQLGQDGGWWLLLWAVELLPGALEHCRLLFTALSPNAAGFGPFSAAAHATSRLPLFLTLEV